MSTFDIQSIVPEGYEIEDFRIARDGDLYLSNMEASIWDSSAPSAFEKIILRKIWTPKLGEVIAVREPESIDWEFDVFERFRDDKCYPVQGERDYWAEYRQLTPKERGE